MARLARAAALDRVRQNGLRLAPLTGAELLVVGLFALLHDGRWLIEDCNRGHGPRAANMQRRASLLPGALLELLSHACTYHANGTTTGDPAVLTCWNASAWTPGGPASGPTRRFSAPTLPAVPKSLSGL